MALTHHTGIPNLRIAQQFAYPPCQPKITIKLSENPFCLGQEVTVTPTFDCIEESEITLYEWYVWNTVVSNEPILVTSDLEDNQGIYLRIKYQNIWYVSNAIRAEIMQPTVAITADPNPFCFGNEVMFTAEYGCVVPHDTESVKYGLLYNYWAGIDARNIANEGWHMPTAREWDTLNKYLSPTAEPNFGNDNTSATPLKDTDATYWQGSIVTATNAAKFYGRGSSMRGTDGSFSALPYSDGRFWSATESSVNNAHNATIKANLALFYTSWWNNTWSQFQVIYANDKNLGLSIRLIKDSTTLSDGEEGIYIGNDGKSYKTICIGTQEWLSENLQETKFRNGDSITEVTDNAAWAALSTQGMCAWGNDWTNVTEIIAGDSYEWLVNGVVSGIDQNSFASSSLVDGDIVQLKMTLNGVEYLSNEITMVEATEGCMANIHYGLLYNAYAAFDVRNIANEGWHIPTYFNEILDFQIASGYNTSGGKMKEISDIYWIQPDTGTTNELGFNARGSGWRDQTGVFTHFRERFWMWNSSINGGQRGNLMLMRDSIVEWGGWTTNYKTAFSIRLVKDSTTLSDGEEGIYIGNDGKSYRTICFYGLEWLADSLAETKFRNGDIIPSAGANNINYTNAEWASLTTPALCPPENDWNNV